MNLIKALGALGATLMIAACGGGGGGAGDSPIDGGGSGGGGASDPSTLTVQVRRSGVSVTQISSAETVQAVATVRDSSGDPIEGVLVTFAETGSLLTLAPATGTALTNAAGEASVDLSATDGSQTGATAIGASANVGDDTLSATRSIQIAAGAGNGGTPPVPAAITFSGSNPSDTAIVIKGTGGNGRSESAILTFKIVDGSNAPINGAEVAFELNSNNGGATISPSTAVSNSAGLVTTIVSSGTQPASIVVEASSVAVPGVSTQSDTLLVSNSVPIAGSFEIVAQKYNLDGRLTGDSTTISAFVADAFGNPVPDGVAVSFTTDFGAIGSSTLGGCITENGVCDVEFRVQDPRGSGLATVFGSVRVGNTETISEQLQINMAQGALALDLDENPVTQLELSSCVEAFELLVSDGAGRAPAAGTTITSPFASSGVEVSIVSGSPTQDQREPGFPPQEFGIEVDLTDPDLSPACNNGGVIAPSNKVLRLQFSTPGGNTVTQRIELAYPQ